MKTEIKPADVAIRHYKEKKNEETGEVRAAYYSLSMTEGDHTVIAHLDPNLLHVSLAPVIEERVRERMNAFAEELVRTRDLFATHTDRLAAEVYERINGWRATLGVSREAEKETRERISIENTTSS